MRQEVSGKIVNGHNRAMRWLQEDQTIADAIGRDLYPGTVNLLISDPGGEHQFILQDLAPGAVKWGEKARFCPCTLNGHRAFIISTWPGMSCDRKFPGHETPIPGTTMIEIVADHFIPEIDPGTADVRLGYDQDDAQTRWVSTHRSRAT